MNDRLNHERPLSVAITSRALSPGGGGCRVAEELGDALRAEGHRVHNWVGRYSGPPLDHVKPMYGRRFESVIRGVHRATDRLGLYEILPLEFLILNRRAATYDVLHVHDIIYSMSPLTVWLLARHHALCCTLHDCSLLTGGCINPMSCKTYPNRCGRCHQHGMWPQTGRFDCSEPLRRLKTCLWINSDITFAAPSNWMREQALSAGIPPERVEVVANGVDTKIFRPAEDKRELRKRLALPEDAKIIVMSAGSLRDRFKGISDGVEALRRSGMHAFLLLLGKDVPDEEALSGLSWRATGYLSDRERMAGYMAAGDWFLHPSFADNLPLVTLEALACGLPVVGYATGGIPEYIRNGHTGFLAARGDLDGLARCLGPALGLSETEYETMSRRCRVVAESAYSLEGMVERYRDLYAKVLARRNRREGRP